MLSTMHGKKELKTLSGHRGSSTPDDIPSMVDDDIIARQLREAAVVEDDPQLRERLWDEYRKFKGLLLEE